MAEDFSKLIKKKSIFSKLGVVDYFTGMAGITKSAPPEGFTQNFNSKDDSKFLVKYRDINYASLANFALAPSSWDVSNFSLSTQLKYDGTADTLQFRTFPNETTLDMYYKRSSFINDPLSIRDGSSQPFIMRDIGTRFGFNNQQSVINIIDGALSPYRAGISTMLDIVSTDATRLTKFMSTLKGISFVAKQVGMQLMNPRSETRIYNPLSIFGAVGGAMVGYHPQRHSLFGLFSNDHYETTTEATKWEGDTNRLIVLRDRTLRANIDAEKNLLFFSTPMRPGVQIAQYSMLGIQLTNPYIFKEGFDIPKNIRTYRVPGPNITTDITTGVNKTPYKFKTHQDYTDILEANNNSKKYITTLETNSAIESLLQRTDQSVIIPKLDPVKSDNGEATSGWDIVTLNFSPYDSADPTISFRAIMDTYSDAWSPSYATVNYVGNPITYPIYQNTRRTISVSFKVPIYFQSELGVVKSKLNQISSYTYPAQVKNTHRIATPYMIFKFGTFINRVVGVISTLTYTVDSTTPWVSATGNAAEFPLVVSVALNIDVVPEGIPVAYYLNNVTYRVENKVISRPPIEVPKEKIWNGTATTGITPSTVSTDKTSTAVGGTGANTGHGGSSIKKPTVQTTIDDIVKRNK